MAPRQAANSPRKRNVVLQQHDATAYKSRRASRKSTVSPGTAKTTAFAENCPDPIAPAPCPLGTRSRGQGCGVHHIEGRRWSQIVALILLLLRLRLGAEPDHGVGPDPAVALPIGDRQPGEAAQHAIRAPGRRVLPPRDP